MRDKRESLRGGAGAHQPLKKKKKNWLILENLWKILEILVKIWTSEIFLDQIGRIIRQYFFFGVPRVIIVNSLIYISNIVVNP